MGEDSINIVTVCSLCAPGRYDYAAASLSNQHGYKDRILVISKTERFYRSHDVHFSTIMVNSFCQVISECETPYLILCNGDTELPTDFVRYAIASGADVYGVPFLEQELTRQFHLISGSMRKRSYLTYGEWCETDVYPEQVVFMKTSLAKAFKWTARCDMPLPPAYDHFYPFMQWTDKQGAKIVVDRSLIGIHHKE